MKLPQTTSFYADYHFRKSTGKTAYDGEKSQNQIPASCLDCTGTGGHPGLRLIVSEIITDETDHGGTFKPAGGDGGPDPCKPFQWTTDPLESGGGTEQCHTKSSL